jgi:hypothetical protein
MGVSFEVVCEWLKNCTEQKALDRLAVQLERQRKVLQDKAAARAARKAPAKR